MAAGFKTRDDQRTLANLISGSAPPALGFGAADFSV